MMGGDDGGGCVDVLCVAFSERRYFDLDHWREKDFSRAL